MALKFLLAQIEDTLNVFKGNQCIDLALFTDW